jgi:hypothetical protein
MAILRLTTESGESWDDPSEDALFEYLSDAVAASEFLIVDRLGPNLDDHYMQVACANGRIVVEAREGSPATHRHAVSDDMRAVHAALTAWAFELPNSPPGLVWRSGPAE